MEQQSEVKDTEMATPKLSMEQRLYAAYRQCKPKPASKEYYESREFIKRVRSSSKQFFKATSQKQFKVAIDVAGGHGLIAFFSVIHGFSQSAYLVDIAKPKSYNSVLNGWSQFIEQPTNSKEEDKSKHKEANQIVDHIQEDLHTALPTLLNKLITEGDHYHSEPISPNSIIVLACHACAHLTDAIHDIVSRLFQESYN